MPDSILVVYATRYGSTQEVAEQVAATLRECGLAVDVQPARQVQTLEGCRAVVLGAPLYIGSLHKDARRFLARHTSALAERPVAVFVLGPTQADQGWQDERAQLDRALQKSPWFKPVAVELFGGKYDPARLRFPISLLAKLPASPLYQAPPTDQRDWEAIRAWAKSVATKL
jgi:menaquinone-dependent protoporphyrinogen oxidase